jgi:hypothetical protein
MYFLMVGVATRLTLMTAPFPSTYYFLQTLAAFSSFSMMSPERAPLATSSTPAVRLVESAAKLPAKVERGKSTQSRNHNDSGGKSRATVDEGRASLVSPDTTNGTASFVSSSSSSSSSFAKDIRSNAGSVSNHLAFLSKVANACRLIYYVQPPQASSPSETGASITTSSSTTATNSALTTVQPGGHYGSLQVPYLNGGVGKGNRFWWTQTLHDVTINLTIPHALKGSQIRVEITRVDAPEASSGHGMVKGADASSPPSHNHHQQLLRISSERSSTEKVGPATHETLFQGILWEEVAMEGVRMPSLSLSPSASAAAVTDAVALSSAPSSTVGKGERSNSSLIWTLEEIVPSEAASLLAQERPLDLREPPFSSFPSPASACEALDAAAGVRHRSSEEEEEEEDAVVSTAAKAVSSSSTTSLITQTFLALPSCQRSLWLGPCKLLSVSLHKKEVGWWRGAITEDTLIDATLVDSTQTVDSYDAETQTAIRKVIHEQSLNLKASQASC